MSEHSGALRFTGRHRARLMRERRGGNRLLVAGMFALVGLALVLLGAGPASGQVAGQAVAGDNGTVKIHDSATAATDPRNEPHVCVFYLDAFGFDPGQSVSWQIKSWSPTGDGSVVDQGTLTLDSSGDGRTSDQTLPNGHYKLFWTFTGEHGAAKHKAFWVSCPSSTPTPPSTSSVPSSTSSSAPSSTSKAPPTSASVPPSSSSAPESTSSAPPSSSSASSSSAVVVPSTSPFVPGPGQTGDNPTPSGFPLRPILLGSGLGLFGLAAVLSGSVLRRRGSHT